MSFLFHERTRKTIKWVWAVIAILIILSMVVAYSGGPSMIARLFA